MTERPEDGYRVAGRIEGRSSRRGRFLALILGVAVVGWAGATVAGRLGGGNPGGTGVSASGDVGRASEPPSLAPGTTVPPAVEIRQASAQVGSIPVVLNGLAWLDPARGAADTRLQEFTEWPFALADGSVCVCLESAAGENPAVLHLFPFDRDGRLTGARSEPWLDTDPGLADVILDPSGGAAIVASIAQTANGWNLRLERIPFDGALAIRASESPIDVADLGDSAQVVTRLTAAPDGSVLRVDLTRLADDPATEWHGAWLVKVAKGGFGPAVATPQQSSDVPATACGGDAWATPTIFVELCHTPRDDGRLGSFARFENLKGEQWDIDLGPVDVDDATGWLVDGARGAVYAWTSVAHGLFRIDATTRELKLRRLTTVDGNGDPMAPTVTPEAPPPGKGPPPDVPGAITAGWQPTNRAGDPISMPLVGSPDGRLLYAAGRSTGLNGAPPSTGIWVFDSASLALVGRWAPAVTYDALGLDPTGRYLIATGGPGAEEVATFGNEGPELAILDRRDGSVVAILRALATRLGGVPQLLPIGP